MSSNGSLGDITRRDLAKGGRRSQPSVLAVAAIVLVAVFLPGKATKTANPGLAAGPNGATPGAGQAAAGTAGGPGGGAQGGGLANGSVLGPTSPAATTSGELTNGSVLPPASPAATTDPWCDPATGPPQIPTLYAPPRAPPFSGHNAGPTNHRVT